MDVKALQKALDYANGVPDLIALTVLKDAVERFLRAQASNPAPKKEPGNQNPVKWPEGLDDLVKRFPQRRSGCPACGCPDGVPHYCTGRPMHTTTGIEYWLNQATAGAADEQRIGGQGISIGSGKGRVS